MPIDPAFEAWYIQRRRDQAAAEGKPIPTDEESRTLLQGYEQTAFEPARQAHAANLEEARKAAIEQEIAKGPWGVGPMLPVAKWAVGQRPEFQPPPKLPTTPLFPPGGGGPGVKTPSLEPEKPPAYAVPPGLPPAERAKQYEERQAASQWEPISPTITAKDGTVSWEAPSGSATWKRPPGQADTFMKGAVTDVATGKVIRHTPPSSEAKGAFSASRQLPAAWEDPALVMERESPLVQDLWREKKAKIASVDEMDARVKLLRSQASLLEQQASDAALPFDERLKRKTQETTKLWSFATEMLKPTVDAEVNRMMEAMIKKNPSMFSDPKKKKEYEDQLRWTIQMGYLAQLVPTVLPFLGQGYRVPSEAYFMGGPGGGMMTGGGS